MASNKTLQMEIEKQRLAEIVRNRRTKKGFTQADLSEKTGISLRSVQRIEKGEVLPRAHTIKALGTILDFKMEDLREPKKNNNPHPSGKAKKLILSFSLPPLIILLAFAYLAQSSVFPETKFELILYWAAMIFAIAILQWFIWVGKKI